MSDALSFVFCLNYDVKRKILLFFMPGGQGLVGRGSSMHLPLDSRKFTSFISLHRYARRAE